MVHIQSEIQIKNDFKILKSLGEIIAVSRHPCSITAIYRNSTLRRITSYGVTSVSKHKILDILREDPWLKFQVDLFNNILIMDAVEQFCHPTETHIYQADDMTFHKEFKVYFPFSEEWEVEIEII